MLLALPFPLWSKDILTGIANTIGRFVSLEKDFHTIFDKRTAKVLVELDVTYGLLLEIEIDRNSVVITHKLNYLKMAFRCSYCHETGHLRKSAHHYYKVSLCLLDLMIMNLPLKPHLPLLSFISPYRLLNR